MMNDKLQGECQEFEERGHYDEYHNWLRQLEQRHAPSHQAGLLIDVGMTTETRLQNASG